jgi:hypothetical protein
MPRAVVVPAGGPAVLKEMAVTPGRGACDAIKAELGGGYLEALRGMLAAAVCYLDEDGKSKGLPANAPATRFCREHVGLWPGDYIVGTMVVLGAMPGREEESDVPAWVVRYFGCDEGVAP